MTVGVIGLGCSIGGAHRSCRVGARRYRTQGFRQLQQRYTNAVHWRALINEPYSGGGDAAHADIPLYLQAAAINNIRRRLGEFVCIQQANAEFPVVLGGDHSCAIATWQAVCRGSPGRIGLIWVDAHLDSHAPLTSPSGKLHGMPLAVLLGVDSQQFTRHRPSPKIVDAHHTVVVGARSFEPAEQALLQRLGVRVFTMQEIAERGEQPVFREAWKIASAAPRGFGISIDLDALDPFDAPGVSVAEPDG